MHVKSVLLASLATLSTVVVAENSTMNCEDVAYIIAARGSITNSTQCGSTDYLANLAEITGPVQQRALGRVTVAPLNYPASTGNPCQPSYLQSRTTGEQRMKSLIESRVNTCADKANVVLLGYSQGAQIITDLISGNSSTGVTALGNEYLKQLKAVILIANPAQKPGATYNNNQSAPDGSQPAPLGPAKPTQPSFIIPNPQKVEGLGSRVVAYCKAGDYFCDAPNSNGSDIHQKEVETWKQPAINFILNRLQPGR